MSSPRFVKILLVFTTIAALVTVGALSVLDTDRINYPPAKRTNHVDVYHGVKVPDPYRWLEDVNSEEVKRWATSQDQLASSLLASQPAQEAIFNRLAELRLFESFTTPVKTASGYFINVTPAGLNYPVVHLRKNLNSEPVVILDPSKHLAEDDILTGTFPSRDGGKLAYLIAADRTTGWRSLKILGVETRQDYPESLLGINSISSRITWSPDGEGFFYVRYELPDNPDDNGAAAADAKIYFHRLGQLQSKDVMVFHEPDHPTWNYQTQVSDDGRFLIITARDGRSTNTRIFFKDLQSKDAEIRALLGRAEASYMFLGNEGMRFYFYTTLNAPLGHIVALNAGESLAGESYEEIIPEAKESIAGGSLVGGNAVGFYGGKLVVMYFKDARSVIRIFTREGKFLREIDMPVIGGSVWGGFRGFQDDPELLFGFLGPAEPRSIYRLDLNSGDVMLAIRPKMSFRPEDFVTKQVFCTSSDGTRVPMFIVHRRDIKLDGSNPAMMYGYGSYGWTAFLWYQPKVFVWLEMGGIFAIPNIRGGGAYGDEWHNAGKGVNKQNTINDFIAAAKWLIDQKYTSDSRLVTIGAGLSSNLVLGASANQRPDLFAGVLISNPGTDMLRYIEFSGNRNLANEFGSPDNPDEFKALLAVSPYHNVAPGKCYPAMLIRVRDDNSTGKMHAFKYVAMLQSAQNCSRPILLKIRRDTARVTTTTELNISEAFELLFAAHAVGMDLSHWIERFSGEEALR